MPDKPFNQLSDDDQKVAVDIGVAVSVLGTRIPSCGKPLYDFIATEFVSCYQLPPNIGKYALRHVGQTLLATEWTFTVEKRGNVLVTTFKREGDRDGDSPLQETTIIH